MTLLDAHASSGPAGVALGGVRSLQARITAAILVTTVSVLMVGCSLFMLEQHRNDTVLEQRRIGQVAAALADGFAESLAKRDGALARRQLQKLITVDRVRGGELLDRGGRRFAMLNKRLNDTPDRSANTQLHTVDLRLDDRPVGELVISTEPYLADGFSRYLALGTALFFSATAIALFLGRWLAARITTPLARLAEAMETVGQSGAFQIRVTPDAPDEIGRLTERFNLLMSRLQVKDLALRGTLAELVEARDAAETANVAKSQFLANMSHEIRTPLNGVLAMAQVLAISPLEAVQREQVDVIRQSGETLLSLLNDILDVSKIEAGKLELEAAPLDVEQVVAAAAAAFAPVAERKGLDLEVVIAPEARGVREGDAARLRQVLNNFLSNALKFTERGGVRVTVEGDGPQGADGVRLEVRDSGMGISAEKLPLLFQKFTQLDASTTRRFGGTGLGLAICRELAELMGGEVGVHSVAGDGSSFSVRLPFRRIAATAPLEGETAPDAPPQEPAPHVDAGGREPSSETARPRLRVLAAEDNQTNQLVLTTIMQIFGVELTLAADGEAAVELWRGADFDLILMDIQMPGMDGVAATRCIRNEEAAAGRTRIPILALSANALTHQVEAYLAAGMDGHVAKPIEIAKLQASLDAALAGGGANADAPEARAA